MVKRLCLALVLVAITLPGVGCHATTHKAPILVAQAGLATAKAIGQISDAGKSLYDAAVIPAAANLAIQERLLQINTGLKPLPDVLRKIDALQVAGASASGEVDRAIAILTVAGQEISLVVGGVPLSDVTKVLVDLIKAAQQAVQTVLIEVGKIKGREQ